jgi:hypothetical protein
MFAFVMSLYPSIHFWKVLVLCPYCGKQHSHGAGEKSGQPMLGWRSAGCQQGEYRLTVDSGSMICGLPSDDPQAVLVLQGLLIAGRNNVLRPPPQSSD